VEKTELRRQRKGASHSAPHASQGKGATLVLGTVKLLHHEKERKLNEDKEGCTLDLKPVPNES